MSRATWWCQKCQAVPRITLDVYPPLCGACRTRCVERNMIENEEAERMAAWLMSTRAQLAAALARDDAQSAGEIFAVLGRWCHEGCHMDGYSVGVCSCDVKHDGTVAGALAALRIVAAHVIEAIDRGEEGC